MNKSDSDISDPSNVYAIRDIIPDSSFYSYLDQIIIPDDIDEDLKETLRALNREGYKSYTYIIRVYIYESYRELFDTKKLNKYYLFDNKMRERYDKGCQLGSFYMSNDQFKPQYLTNEDILNVPELTKQMLKSNDFEEMDQYFTQTYDLGIMHRAFYREKIIVEDSIVALDGEDISLKSIPYACLPTLDKIVRSLLHAEISGMDSILMEITLYGNDSMHIKDSGPYPTIVMVVDVAKAYAYSKAIVQGAYVDICTESINDSEIICGIYEDSIVYKSLATRYNDYTRGVSHEDE